MKTGIHPQYHQIKIACACGNSFDIGSTMAENVRVEICAQCHPLYTGKSKFIDTAGRLERFNTRVQKAQELKAAAEAKAASKAKKIA